MKMMGEIAKLTENRKAMEDVTKETRRAGGNEGYSDRDQAAASVPRNATEQLGDCAGSGSHMAYAT